jgi:homoserine kinase
MIIRSAQKLAEQVGKRLPPFHLDCVNRIPLSSGLGSSAAAKVTGLLGANKLLGMPLSNDEILDLAAEMEGHPDNVAPALLGGLVVSTVEGGNVFAHKVSVNGNHNPLGNFESPFQITVVLPDFHIPTLQARAALPDQVPMADAVYNVSRAVLVTEAFRNGDLELLRRAMTDALHQPYRLSLIPGAQEAMDAGKEACAAAIALSGAGPSLIAFSLRRDPSIGEAMTRAFEQAGLSARVFQLKMSNHGAEAQIR